MFHDVLLETTTGERHRRTLTLLATLAGEALVIAALVAVPLLYLDAIPGFSVHAAPVDVTFHPLHAIAVDPGQGPRGGRSVAIARPTDEFVIPRTIANPQLIYGHSRAASDETVAPNVPLPQDCCGNGAGRGGSDLIARVAVPPPPAKPPLISRVEEGMIVKRVDPAYPTLARQAHIQGEVVLRVFISQSGNIENLRVVSGHPFLTKAAIDAVQQWRFRPYYLNGTPIEVEAQITVRFVLGGGL
jgi:protein TonB